MDGAETSRTGWGSGSTSLLPPTSFAGMIPLVIATGFGAAFLLSWGFNRLALIPWRHSAGLSWTERARELYPARMSARVNLWLIAAGNPVWWIAQNALGARPGF